MLHARGALSATACAALRAAVDNGGACRTDSVDGLPNHDLPLNAGALAEIVGVQSAAALMRLPRRFAAQRAASRAARGATLGATTDGADTDYEIISAFARRYLADSIRGEQPLTSFHCDAAAMTVNVALGDEGRDGSGGLLLGLFDDKVREIRRCEGDATTHSSALMHGVSRVLRADVPRYTLIMFFRRRAAPG